MAPAVSQASSRTTVTQVWNSAAVKVGRFAGLDSEQALHGTCEKFIRRFRRVEELAGGRPLDSLGLHRLEELWQQAKQDEA